jgi:TPR repeat protein
MRPNLTLAPHANGNHDGDAEARGMSEVVERALTETNSSGAALALETDGRVVCCARAGECAPPLGAELDREAGISGLCLRRGDIVRCDEASTDLRVDREAARRLGIASILAVPIKIKGTIVGLLEVFSESPYAFGIMEETSLVQAAQRVVAVLGGEDGELDKQDSWDSIVDMVSEPETHEVVEDGMPAAVEASQEIAPLAPELSSSKPRTTAEDKADAAIVFHFGDSLTQSGPKHRLLLPIAGLAVIAGAAIALSLPTGGSPANKPAAPKVSQSVGKDTSELDRLRVAAQQGDSTAQLTLARKYRDGEGVERDEAQAVSWLQQAARLGNSDAQYELDNAYGEGSGVERDPILAYACYVLASANGNPASDEALRLLIPKLTDGQIAQVRSTIGEMYLQGRGTPVDYVAAYTWFKLAESAGSGDGQRLRAEVASKMTKQQIAAADRRADEWLKRHSPQAR